MVNRHNVLLNLFVVFFTTFDMIESQEKSVCSFSLKKQILTCENVSSDDADIGNLISNSTQMLIIKRSFNLTITPHFNLQPFEVLTTYHFTECMNLDIYPFSFQKLTKLKYIKIIDNTYSTIKNNTFYGLHNLEILSLNNNSITHIENDAFNSLSRLETLELTHNTFKTVPSNVFKSLTNLKSLFLYHNTIEILEENCLQGLDNLNVLDLTYNRITNIKPDMFNHLPLTQLYLSFNQIETIEGDMELKKLEFLYLQNNKLRNVSSTVFNSMENLADIDLSKNKINEISEEAFFNLTKLMNLNYRENNMNGAANLTFKGIRPLITS